ncbi:MAG: hypothetical protein V2A73_06405, partial [Pseudomonadota bacterium]
SLGVVALAALAYFFVAEHFRLFHDGPIDRQALKHVPPQFDGSGVMKTDPYGGGIGAFSLAGVLGAAIAVALLPEAALAGSPVSRQPVAAPVFGNQIVLDGDRDGVAVAFDHRAHVER